MKVKRRYNTEAEILAAIDRAHARALNWAKRAEALDAQITEAKRTNKNKFNTEFDIREAQRQADKLWSMQRSTHNKALPLLKKKLAEFKTTTMFGMEKDIPR